MILGIGVDILSLSRFQAVISRRGIDRVAKRICTPRELNEFTTLTHAPIQPTAGTTPDNAGNANDRHLRFLSSRWAMKEAAYKALYPSLPLVRARYPDYVLTFTTLEMTHTRGVPAVRMVLPVKDGEEGIGISLLGTISHDAGVVVGVVIAQKRE